MIELTDKEIIIRIETLSPNETLENLQNAILDVVKEYLRIQEDESSNIGYQIFQLLEFHQQISLTDWYWEQKQNFGDELKRSKEIAELQANSIKDKSKIIVSQKNIIEASDKTIKLLEARIKQTA